MIFASSVVFPDPLQPANPMMRIAFIYSDRCAASPPGFRGGRGGANPPALACGSPPPCPPRRRTEGGEREASVCCAALHRDATCPDGNSGKPSRATTTPSSSACRLRPACAPSPTVSPPIRSAGACCCWKSPAGATIGSGITSRSATCSPSAAIRAPGLDVQDRARGRPGGRSLNSSARQGDRRLVVHQRHDLHAPWARRPTTITGASSDLAGWGLGRCSAVLQTATRTMFLGGERKPRGRRRMAGSSRSLRACAGPGWRRFARCRHRGRHQADPGFQHR